MDEQKIQQFKQAALQSGYAQDEIDSFMAQIGSQSGTQAYDPTGKTFDQMMAETGNQSTLDAMNAGGFNTPSMTPMRQSSTQSFGAAQPESMVMSKTDPMVNQLDSLGAIPTVTQPFGNRSSVEKYSGGINLGTDFRADMGTPLGTPKGTWIVSDAKEG